MDKKKIKVIYVAGPSRSGSTLLSNILGEIEGFFYGGELIDFWDRGLLENVRCGCGKQMNICGLWNEIIDKGFCGITEKEVRQMILFRDVNARSYKIPLGKFVPEGKGGIDSGAEQYANNLKKLYVQIQESTKCNVIIDSSKSAGYARLLGTVPDIDLYILHLVRDSRATAYSWLRKKKGLWKVNSVVSCLIWNSRNISSEILGKNAPLKYMRLHYEEFVSAPQKSVKQILQWANESYDSLPFLSPGQVKLGTNHCMYGNPDRFKSGVLTIKADEEWKKTKKVVQLIATAITWPLLVRYGYSIIPQKS